MNLLVKAVLLRTLGFFLWVSLTAWLFVAVEYEETDEKVEKYKLLLSLYEFLASKYNMSIEEFNNISNSAYEALSQPKLQWTYCRALDFVFQSLTTIGYGYITPQTQTGQMLCIFVSLLGIPITLLAFKSVGELIAKGVATFVTKFEKKILKRSEPKKLQAKSALILFLMMIFLILLSSLLLVHSVNWSFVTGAYFWFITFTTIGFGDYVPGLPQRMRQLTLNNFTHEDNEDKEPRDGEETKIIFEGLLLPLYFILGLCIVSSVLNSIMMALEERKCRPPCPGCVPRRTQNQGDIDDYTPTEGEANTATCLSMDNYGFHKENMTPVVQ